MKYFISLLFIFSFNLSAKGLSTRSKIISKIGKSKFYKPKMKHGDYKLYLQRLSKKRKPKTIELKSLYLLGKIEASLSQKKRSAKLKNSALNHLYFASIYKYKSKVSRGLYKKLAFKKKKKRVKKIAKRKKKVIKKKNTKKVFETKKSRLKFGLTYMSWQEDKVLETSGNSEIIDSTISGPGVNLKYDLSKRQTYKLQLNLDVMKGKLDTIGNTTSTLFVRDDLSSISVMAGAEYLYRINEGLYLGAGLDFLMRKTDYKLDANQEIIDPGLRTIVPSIIAEMNNEKFGFSTKVGKGLAMSGIFMQFGLHYYFF